MPEHLTRRRKKEIASLQKKRDREARGELLLEGIRNVDAAITAGAPLLEVLVTPEAREDERVQSLLSRVRTPVYDVSAREMERLTDAKTHQGILAIAHMTWFPAENLPDLRSLVVLDGVQDPGNVGAIMRNAAWFGIDAILAGPGTAGLFGPKVVRAAAGSLWDVHLSTANDLPELLSHLAAHDFTCYGADLEGTPCPQWQPRRPSALVMGSEAHGLSPGVQKLLNERIYIPGAPRRQGTESLNVAIASGILLYQYAHASTDTKSG